jgi:hypothetical protein
LGAITVLGVRLRRFVVGGVVGWDVVWLGADVSRVGGACSTSVGSGMTGSAVVVTEVGGDTDSGMGIGTDSWMGIGFGCGATGSMAICVVGGLTVSP